MSNSQSLPQKSELLGEILIKRDLISKQQLNQALEVQKKERGYVGEILVRLGYVEERDIIVALIVQCNLPYIAINKYEVAKSIVQLIPEEVAKKYHVVALDRVGNVLSVVMADPFDTTIKAEIRRETNCEVATFIATKDEISKAIDRLY